MFSACALVFLTDCFQFIFFFQKALYYFSGKIFFRRTEAVAWGCFVKSTSNVSRKVHSKIPVSDSFLSVKFEDRDLKKSIRYRCFLVNFEKVLRISERRSHSSYLSYGIFGNCLPAEKVFTLVFTKQAEKVKWRGLLDIILLQKFLPCLYFNIYILILLLLRTSAN